MLETLTAAGAGALLSGAGSILGGLGIGSKKPDPAFQIALQEQSALRHEKNSFDQKMALAKTHGLHPLSVLGVPMNTITPSISTGSPGVDFSAIGSGAERIAQTFVKPPEAEQPAEDLNAKRLVDAQVRTAEANASRTEWDALRSQWTTQDLLRGQPGNPPAVRVSNDAASIRTLAAAQAGVHPSTFGGAGVDLEQKVTPPHPSILGHSLGVDQSLQRMVDKDGHLYSMPNPNVYQPDIEQFGTFHYLSNKYGVDKAMNIMAALEQAPLVGGLLGTAGAGAYAAYRYFGRQRQAAELKRNNYPRIPGLAKKYRPDWKASSRNE